MEPSSRSRFSLVRGYRFRTAGDDVVSCRGKTTSTATDGAPRSLHQDKLALCRLAEGDLHQVVRHVVKLRLKILIFTGEFLPERCQVH